MKFHPLSELFPLMQGREFDELVADIKANGLREPIWTYQGQILDGRNRWRACEAANVVTRPCRPYEGDDPLGFVLSLNLHRRHLTDAQKAVLALDILPHLEAQARERMGRASQGREKIPDLEQGKAAEKAATTVGVNPRYVSDAKRIAKEAPELVDKLRSGELSVPAAMRQLKENHNKSELQRPVSIDLPSGLQRGDFRELSNQIPDNSVELIFTDPPYDVDSISLYEDAARIASRILRPGGSFIAYSGQRHLPQVLTGCGKHLLYWWTIAGVHSGGNQILQKLGIRCGWKPLVWFVKDKRGDVQNVLLDVVTGNREKDAHRWQQAESEAIYYIEHLTSPGGLVVDFFIGGGTTAVAAQKLGRRWIGFEVDAGAAETTAKRLVSV